MTAILIPQITTSWYSACGDTCGAINCDFVNSPVCDDNNPYCDISNRDFAVSSFRGDTFCNTYDTLHYDFVGSPVCKENSQIMTSQFPPISAIRLLMTNVILHFVNSWIIQPFPLLTSIVQIWQVLFAPLSCLWWHLTLGYHLSVCAVLMIM